jgi:transglutaminase superfamily protein
MSRSVYRIIITIVLTCFIWTHGGIYSIAVAAKTKTLKRVNINKPKTKKEKSLETKLTESVQAIETALEDSSLDMTIQKSRMKSEKEKIQALDVKIKEQLKSTEEKLKNAKLPKEILKRHEKFVQEYETKLKELYKIIDDIDAVKIQATYKTKAKKTKNLLKKFQKPPKKSYFDPNNLPHSSRKPIDKKPRLHKKDFENDFGKNQATRSTDSTLLASIGSMQGILGQNIAAAMDQPGPVDLAQNIEVKFTPDIVAKAAELEHHPVKIYNWVRNNIEFVPTYGSIQGAQMTLETLQGNAFDTASLLIALLRASNIPARYAMGTVEIPIDQVMNWVGDFTSDQAALEFIARGHIPINGITQGGKFISAQMEHVWVKAYVDYMPFRGARHQQGKGDTWISLDASFKQYDYTNGIDMEAAVPFNAQAFVDDVTASATINEEEGYVTGLDSLLINNTLQNYQSQVENYIEQNYPDATVGDVLGKSVIIKKEYPYLLGTLPYQKVVMGASYADIPDQLRHKLSFELKKDVLDMTPLSTTKSLPELAGKKITLSYSPATPGDEAVIESYLPEPHLDGSPIQPDELPESLPAYLINVIPELRVDGEVVATGTPVGLGNAETFTMQFYDPTSSEVPIVNEIDAGVYQAIGLNLGKISQAQVDELKAKLETTKAQLEAQNYSEITKEEILGDLFHTTAIIYHAELGISSYVSSKTIGVASLVHPSETMFGTGLKVESTFGVPHTVAPEGLIMDADRLMFAVKSLDGISDKEKNYMLNTGTASSALEHSVPEKVFSTPDSPAIGISAVKALQIANEQGIRIYNVNKDNITSVLPQLEIDSQVKNEINNAVNAGKEVTVSGANIDFNGWVGCGYITIDPETGAGAYMITGGDNGAMTSLSWGAALFLFLAGTGILQIGVLVLALLIAVNIISNLVLYWINAECSAGGLEYLAYAVIVLLPFLAGRGIESIRSFIIAFIGVEGAAAGTNIICQR